MEPMSLNNIVLIVTASVSKIYIHIFVLIFAVLVSEFHRYLKLSVFGPVSGILACLHAGGAS